MYGLPKIHKRNIPLDQFYQWLALPNTDLLSGCQTYKNLSNNCILKHCISDLFTFANPIWNMTPNNSFFHSFDIVNLYTNIPQDEMIAICTDTVYCSHLDPLPFQNPSFWKWNTLLLSMCNSVSITLCTMDKLESIGVTEAKVWNTLLK